MPNNKPPIETTKPAALSEMELIANNLYDRLPKPARISIEWTNPNGDELSVKICTVECECTCDPNEAASGL